MSVDVQDDVVRVVGEARVEDAEALCAALAARPGRPVDLAACTRLHTAVLQALLALDAAVVGAPADAFQRRWLARLFPKPAGSCHEQTASKS